MLDYLKIFVLLIAVSVVSGVIVMKVVIFQAGEPIIVPDISGKEVIPALEALDRAGLYLKIVRLDFSTNVPKDRVVSQNPLPGETIKKGRDVRVIISRGSKSVIIPSLIGSSLLRAETVMAKNGIKIRKRVKIYSNKPESEILAQKPSPRTSLLRGDAMTLLVSAGPYPEYLMAPDFVGEPVSSAMKRIEKIDLKVSSVSYEPSDEIKRGIVLSQAPPFGKRALRGSFISLVASKGAAETSGAPATFSFLYYTIPERAKAVSVSITQENEDGDKEIYNRTHKPGDTISLLVQVKGKTVVKIFMDDELSEVRRY